MLAFLPVADGNAADTKRRERFSTSQPGSPDHTMKPIDVKRSTVVLDPDRTRVLARPFRLMSDQRSSKTRGYATIFATIPLKQLRAEME